MWYNTEPLRLHIPAHAGPQGPVVSSELVGDLEGQGGSQGQVSQGQVDHEDDGGGLGRGAEQQQPHGEAVSAQVDHSDHHVDDGDG